MHNQSNLEDMSLSTDDALVKDYLEKLTAPLVEVLPYAEREALRMEFRLHLLAIAAAHEELGYTRADALAAALRDFGNPRKIGRGIYRAHKKPLKLPYIPGLAGGFVAAPISIAAGRLADMYMVNSGLVANSGGSINDLIWSAFGFLGGCIVWKYRLNSVRAASQVGTLYGLSVIALSIPIGWISSHPVGIDLGYTRMVLISSLIWAVAGAGVGGLLGAVRKLSGRFGYFLSATIDQARGGPTIR
jgi:hypothetical protein